jgi:hypothetical protein
MVSIVYAFLVLLVISLAEPFTRGIVCLGGIVIGMIYWIAVRNQFRSFYTLLTSGVIYAGMLVAGIIQQRELDRGLDADFFIVFGVLLVFAVALPTAIAAAVTLFKKDTNAN